MESVEDADSLLVAGGQYGIGNRYMDNFIGCSILTGAPERKGTRRTLFPDQASSCFGIR